MPLLAFARASFLAAVVLMPPHAARATVLAFDQQLVNGVVVPTTDASDLPPGYGNRVAGPSQAVPGGQYTYTQGGEGFTPNITVAFTSFGPFGANDTSLWSNDYGDLTNVLLGNENSGTLDIRFAADAGYTTLLHGFDLAGWSNTDYTIDAVRVLGDGNPLFVATSVLVEGNFTGPRHTSFAFATPLQADALHIEIDYGNLAGRQQDNIGIDHIRFGQFPAAPVPEWPVAWLLALGLAAMPWRRAGPGGPASCGHAARMPAAASVAVGRHQLRRGAAAGRLQ